MVGVGVGVGVGAIVAVAVAVGVAVAVAGRLRWLAQFARRWRLFLSMMK